MKSLMRPRGPGASLRVLSSSSTVLRRRRLRGRTGLASDDRDAGARADEDRCGEGLAERLASVMMTANSATALKGRESGGGFASVRGFDQRCCRYRRRRHPTLGGATK